MATLLDVDCIHMMRIGLPDLDVVSICTASLPPLTASALVEATTKACREQNYLKVESNPLVKAPKRHVRI
jgi:hypothetical protein